MRFNRLSSSRNEYLVEADHAGEMETKFYKALPSWDMMTTLLCPEANEDWGRGSEVS